MFLSFYGRQIGAPLKGTNMGSFVDLGETLFRITPFSSPEAAILLVSDGDRTWLYMATHVLSCTFYLLL